MPPRSTAVTAASRSPPCPHHGCRIASKPAAGASRVQASVVHTSVPARPGQARSGDRMICTRPQARAWPRRRFRGSWAGHGMASSAPPASPTELFVQPWKLFHQQSGPPLGRLSACLLLHWRKRAIPKCLSIFFPLLAVGDADEEMVGGMVDDS